MMLLTCCGNQINDVPLDLNLLIAIFLFSTTLYIQIHPSVPNEANRQSAGDDAISMTAPE